MNTGLIPLVRSALCVTALVLGVPCLAQGGKDGLTKDFDKLSAKERTRIAAKENMEAAVDTGYQSLMRSAENAFRDGEYETALAHYQEARKMRPYNVYPKVKIQDLQVLLEHQRNEKPPPADPVLDTTEAAPGLKAPSAAPEPPPVEAPTVAAPAAVPPAPVAVPAIADPPPAPQTVGEKAPAVPPPASPAPARAPAPPVPVEAQVPKALGERVFIEAGAVVTERTVLDDERPTVYRRVVHPSGQVFTFKDGLSIPERMWNERFGE